MTTILGYNDIKQEYVNAMGRDLGGLFHDLWEEVSALHMYWGEFVELYGSGQERIDLLNRSASGFFWITHKVMLEYVVLHITRLLDAPKTKKQARATLKALPAKVDATLKLAVQRQLDAIAGRAAFCWDWRDRHLAHRDLELALERAAKPLLEGSRDDIGEILEGMANLLNTVREHYRMSRLTFDLASPTSGADNLLRMLQLALMMRERRNAQMKRGEEPDGGYRLPPV